MKQNLSNRREFLRGAVAVGAATALSPLVPGYARNLFGLSPTGRRNVIDLAIGRHTLMIDDRSASAVTVNGSIPGPLLRLKEGETATLRVRNDLDEDTSIHWHGLIVPADQDGVPGLSFGGVLPGQTFTYEYPVQQGGTYWYHSHSGLQEQQGVYGPLIIDPVEPEPFSYDREYVVLLSDWTFENPYTVLANLKKQGGYYNFQRRTLGDLVRDIGKDGLGATVADRLRWGRMRMDATDIADVTGATYAYLMNGMAPSSNWTGLFRRGERVRLRFINGAAASYFDVHIPGLRMTVVQADGQNIQPVDVEEFRIAVAETFDVIVEPDDERAYTIFAESMDRSGFASGTLTPRVGMTAPIPERRPRPSRTMADMGMAMDMDMSVGETDMAGMPADTSATAMPGMENAGHEMDNTSTDESVPHGSDTHGPGAAGVAEVSRPRLDDPGIGLGNDGRRVLLYSDLKGLAMIHDMRAPRDIELHLTGNMERYMWSFDGKKFSQSPDPIQMEHGERVRLTFVNDTMMEHPIHLHGMWMELDNGNGMYNPRKHTVNVKPAERMSVLVTPDVPGRWAFHCHILYHMESGMFRIVEVAEPRVEDGS